MSPGELARAVSRYAAEHGPEVDALLDALLPKSDESPRSLHAAMRHLVFPGGKRIRPLFAIAGAEAVGGCAGDALPMAVAVELIHNYSLVHDDLPCMDDDSERRGRPTVHVAYGEAVAVLAGDALQTLAFEALTNTELAPARAAVAVRTLARAAGAQFLIGGQVDDLAFADDAGGTGLNERVESVHARKSAALIAAAIAGGAQLAGASEDQVHTLESFGREVGIAFQIADDVLDQDEDDACSSVRALGLEGARARADELLARALERLASYGDGAEPLRTLARFAVHREN